MQKPLQIAYRDMESSPALDQLIRERVAALERFFPRLIGCRVVVEVPHRSAESAKVPIAVSVEVEVPGRGVVVAKDTQERREVKGDETAALNHAFDAVERQLRRINEEQHGDVRPHEADGESGMVVRLFPEQSYGFIEIDNSPELYFTRNAVVGGDFDELEVGMLVHVTPATEEGPMGPQASSVRLLNKLKTPDRE